MDFLKQFGHISRNQKKEHFNHLLSVAWANGILSQQELDELRKLGRRLGLSDVEIEQSIENPKESEYHPPFEFEARFEEVFQVVRIILADGEVDDRELHIAEIIALRTNFPPEEIPQLLSFLIEGIKMEKSSEDLFLAYRKIKRA